MNMSLHFLPHFYFGSGRLHTTRSLGCETPFLHTSTCLGSGRYKLHKKH